VTTAKLYKPLNPRTVLPQWIGKNRLVVGNAIIRISGLAGPHPRRRDDMHAERSGQPSCWSTRPFIPK
jgi:hypothetical protein